MGQLRLDGGPRHVPGGFTAAMIAGEDGSFRTNLTYHYIGHFSRYILSGARRIGFSRYTDQFEMTAARNADGSITSVFLNKRDKDTGCAVRIRGKVIRVTLPAGTLTTLILTDSE